MTDYEMLIVILTTDMLIVSIIALCFKTKNKPPIAQSEAYFIIHY